MVRCIRTALQGNRLFFGDDARASQGRDRFGRGGLVHEPGGALGGRRRRPPARCSPATSCANREHPDGAWTDWPHGGTATAATITGLQVDTGRRYC